MTLVWIAGAAFFFGTAAICAVEFAYLWTTRPAVRYVTAPTRDHIAVIGGGNTRVPAEERWAA